MDAVSNNARSPRLAAWLIPLAAAAIVIAASAFMVWTYREPGFRCFGMGPECTRPLTLPRTGLRLPLGWHMLGIALALGGYCLAALRSGSLRSEGVKAALLLGAGCWAIGLRWRMDELLSDKKGFIQHLTPSEAPGQAAYRIGSLLLALGLLLATARLIRQASAAAETAPSGHAAPLAAGD